MISVFPEGPIRGMTGYSISMTLMLGCGGSERKCRSHSNKNDNSVRVHIDPGSKRLKFFDLPLGGGDPGMVRSEVESVELTPEVNKTLYLEAKMLGILHAHT